MSGYRQHSYDPNAYERLGRTLRPFNWVQWTGVAIEVTGLILFLVTIAQKLGWITQGSDIPPTSGIMLMLVGMSLINSRREPLVDLAPELAPARKRWLIITAVICAVILGIAILIEISGA